MADLSPHWRIRRLRYRLLVLVGVVMLFATTLVHEPSIQPAQAASYNRANAINYADAWAHARNSAYPSYSSDCTNFASQVLEAGGLPQIPGDHNRDNNRLWFFYNDWLWGYVNSKTWSAANWMNEHFFQYQGTRFTFNPPQDQSDIMVIRWHTQDTPDTFHIRVIVGYGNSQEYVPGGQYGRTGIWGLLADQHTNDRKRIIWNDGFFSDTAIWPWRVIW